MNCYCKYCTKPHPVVTHSADDLAALDARIATVRVNCAPPRKWPVPDFTARPDRPSAVAGNYRDRHFITIDGRTQSVSSWAREVGLDPKTVFGRIRNGYSERDAVMTPRGVRGRK